MLEFARIQDTALNLEVLTAFKHFQSAVEQVFLLVRFETIMKDARFRH